MGFIIFLFIASILVAINASETDRQLNERK